MEIDIEINEKLVGDLVWLSLASNSFYQEWDMRWENIGSVNCNVLPRIEFFDSQGKRVYTSWGLEVGINSGASNSFKLYSALPSGSYVARPRILHCNEIFDQEDYDFTVSGPWERKDGIILDVSAHSGQVTVRTSEEAVIVPIDYPKGWEFQSGKTDENGVAVIGFDPVGTNQAKATFAAITPDGRYEERQVSMITEENSQFPWTLLFGVVLILLIVLYFSKNIIKIWKR